MPGTGIRDCKLRVAGQIRSSWEASQAGTLVAWRAKALAKWGTALAQYPDGLPGIARYYFFLKPNIWAFPCNRMVRIPGVREFKILQAMQHSHPPPCKKKKERNPDTITIIEVINIFITSKNFPVSLFVLFLFLLWWEYKIYSVNGYLNAQPTPLAIGSMMHSTPLASLKF